MKKSAQAFDDGKDPVIALYHRMISQLAPRVQALEDRVSENSRNSGKSPPSDGLAKPAPKTLREPNGEKSSGQPGHKGNKLKPVAQPDYIQVHTLVKQSFQANPLPEADPQLPKKGDERPKIHRESC